MSNFQNNTAKNRFEYSVDGHTAFANYRIQGDTLFIDYVEAPPALRGKGAAGALMTQLMAEVKAQKLKAHPICGYAASWLRKHEKDYQGFLA